jgi:glucan endo-1,3-alpha-glucosidase
MWASLLAPLLLSLLGNAFPSLETRAAIEPSNLVIAHFMVGNTYPYTVSNWASDIALASSKGLDAFVLNLGSDDWQPARIADAFAAAKNAGPKFKIGFSFDMTVLRCGGSSNATLLQNYINTYSSHPNILQYDNKMLITTFAGQSCTFGQASVDAGWTFAIKTGLPAVYFIPSFFVDPATFSSYPSTDGQFNWNGGWPMDDSDITFNSDNTYISNLGGKTYLGAVSPWFFTHYGADSYNKNFIYRFDDWLFSERWELLIANRDKVPIAEVITWNDYGESHYVGPIEGAQPNSQAWVDGFDHQGWLDLMHYYITYFKTGSAPRISTDRIFLWSRLYPEAAKANDPVGPPQNANYTQDFLWAEFLLTRPSDLTLTCGSSTQTFTGVPAGVSKQKLALTTDCSVSAKISRYGFPVVTFTPKGMNFSTTPPSYNFNAFVAASPC